MPRANAMRVRLELTGVERTSQTYTGAQHRAEFPRPAFVAIGGDFERIARAEFDSSGSYSGKRWAPLAESTKKKKRRLGQDPRILIATSDLRESLERPGGDHVQEMQRNRLDMGTSVPYAAIHQKGRRNMPARRIFVPHRDRRRWIETLRAYVMTGDTR